jgi:hypothetical protein
MEYVSNLNAELDGYFMLFFIIVEMGLFLENIIHLMPYQRWR